LKTPPNKRRKNANSLELAATTTPTAATATSSDVQSRQSSVDNSIPAIPLSDTTPTAPQPELQTATSTTPGHEAISPSAKQPQTSHVLPSDPAEWSVDDAMRYLSSVDSGLSIHAQLFQKHVSSFNSVVFLFIERNWMSLSQEIDGKALLLLTSDMMMKYMGLKLGPSLKICNIVNKLKGRRHVLL
jgi:polycomb protein SCMH1